VNSLPYLTILPTGLARRKSYQKGSIEWKNGKPTPKYELRVGNDWLTKRESMPEWVNTQKQANQHRDQGMIEINKSGCWRRNAWWMSEHLPEPTIR
jgi:hypothetical protein